MEDTHCCRCIWHSRECPVGVDAQLHSEAMRSVIDASTIAVGLSAVVIPQARWGAHWLVLLNHNRR